MGKRKILVYTENYLPSIGGLENNTLLLCESLVSLNFDITLVTPQKKAIQNHLFKVIESKSLLDYYLQIKKHDFILVNGGVAFKIIFPAILAFKSFSIIYQMATLFNDIRSNNLKTKFLNYLRKNLASLARKNIAVSEYSFLELGKIYGKNKVGLIINPADPVFFSSNLKNEKNLLNPFKCLFAGRLISGKGIELLIEAIHKINDEYELVHLDIVGDGPLKESIIKEASHHNYINYHLPVKKEELKGWYQKAHLTLIPSSSHVEGSPLVLAESLSMGTPVLVSSQPAMIASIKNENLIFELGNVDDLINKLKSLMVEKKYWAVQNFCKKIAPNYSYSKYITDLKSIIDV